MPERRYSDEDVKRILFSAVESDAALSTDATECGMTLAEIQSIAAEAGVSPASVGAAADALDHPPSAPANARVFGLPISVGHTVALPRALDDAEWRRLVAFLRDTFQAQGREEQVAGRREWRNGNLRITVESLGDSALLQMRTRKSDARSLIRAGISLLLGSVVVETATTLAHRGAHAAAGVLTLALGGAAMAAVGALQLPSWSAARRKQFDAVAQYARRLSAGEDVGRLP